MMTLTFILTLTLLILASGYFSSSETALFSLSPIKIKTYSTSPSNRKKLIANLLKKPKDLLVTVFMLNTFINIILQNVASGYFGEDAGMDVKIGIPLVLTLLFGEIIPKNLGLQWNETISYYVAPSIEFFQNLLRPLRKLIIKITAPISRILFFFLKREQNITKEELTHVLETSEENNIISPDEAEIIRGYLSIQDSQVKELMWHKEEIVYYDIHAPLSELISLFMDKQCSRIPVCEGGTDQVIGIITAKKYFINQPMIKIPEDIKRYMVKPFYIPEITSARFLLKLFDEMRNEMALVVNEYGSISGIITKEDLVEVVIGDIVDIRDQKSSYTLAGKNELIANGRMELSEFNKFFDVELVSRFNTITLGGWLTEEIGDIPKSGMVYETQEFLFQILSSDPNKVRRVYVRRKNGGRT